ncbi:MAG: HupE/UreJ family protein [Myxococcales bacterium]|nr:HupE/UreJ family protein [Myxococcales bacterium]
MAGSGARWSRRCARTAVLVSAFTIAHSLTLIAAALGWVSLPAQLVECAIAASIVWTAAASAIRPGARGGWAVAFGFGLMHGLGFARMLTPLLPPGDVIVPLLCFNVGVELAQLTIVAVALPVTWALARAIGAPAYRRYARCRRSPRCSARWAWCGSSSGCAR